MKLTSESRSAVSGVAVALREHRAHLVEAAAQSAHHRLLARELARAAARWRCPSASSRRRVLPT